MPFPTILSITPDEIDLDALLRQITLPTTGAAAIFTGMVRQVTQREPAHETRFLEYEAYEAMAQAKMQQVADEIRERWPIVRGHSDRAAHWQADATDAHGADRVHGGPSR